MTQLRIFVCMVLALTVSGCATSGKNPDQWLCAAAGALIAGGGAAAVDGDEGAAVASAAVGGALGYLACNRGEPKPKPQPKPQPPPPAPEPEPEKDTDGDGVLDRMDRCPGTPRGTPVDSRGCPEIPDLQGVNFEFNRSALTPEGTRILDEAARILERNPHVRVEIVGHTDNVGSDSYNQRLSERRAGTVRDYLAAKGIAERRMLASGAGEHRPVATNETDAGRARNRRVELTAHPL